MEAICAPCVIGPIVLIYLVIVFAVALLSNSMNVADSFMWPIYLLREIFIAFVRAIAALIKAFFKAIKP